MIGWRPIRFIGAEVEVIGGAAGRGLAGVEDGGRGTQGREP